MTLYNPAQQRVIDLLGRRDDDPELPDGLDLRLAAELEAGLASLATDLGEERLWVNKHTLAGVHGCETHHLASQDTFAWSVPRIRGQVAHKAIELAVNWRGEPLPALVVDDAIARLADGEDGAGRFLAGLPEAERAQLRGEATDLVTKFQECFPALKPEWRPVTESRVYVELFDGRIVLSGKVDLTLGRHEPGRSRKVLIDLKSGMPFANHGHDLRFYALLETIRLGTPPRRLATYYLDGARAQPEVVTVAVLDAALARTVDGVRKLVELGAGREPTVQPGPACRWCPVADHCAEGKAWLWSSEEGAA